MTEDARKAALAGLRARARARKRAVTKLAERDAELHSAIREADAAGIPRLTIFRESGYGARQTIYDVLGNA